MQSKGSHILCLAPQEYRLLNIHFPLPEQRGDSTILDHG